MISVAELQRMASDAQDARIAEEGRNLIEGNRIASEVTRSFENDAIAAAKEGKYSLRLREGNHGAAFEIARRLLQARFPDFKFLVHTITRNNNSSYDVLEACWD